MGGIVDLVFNSIGGFNVNLLMIIFGGSIGLVIFGVNYVFDFELFVVQIEGCGEVIFSLCVIIVNQQEVVICQGQQIGYVMYQNSVFGVVGSGMVIVQFKDVVLEFKVMLIIIVDNWVYLKINVKKDVLVKFIDVFGSGQVLQIDMCELNIFVLVDNGQIVVLGGIYEIIKQNFVIKVLGLGDIFGIGVLFCKILCQNDKVELLIFVMLCIFSDMLQ